ACGVERPIGIVPLGIDTGVFRPREMNMQGKCVFGAAGRIEGASERKGVNEVIFAFQQAFPNEEDVALHLKTFADCRIAELDDPRIKINREYLSAAEMADWFSRLTCFVSAARAEGWGMMQHQALAVGRPIISIRFAGVAEFFEPDAGYPLDFDLVPAADAFYGRGLWEKPDPRHMIHLMRTVYKNREEARKRGRKGALCASRFSAENAHEKLLNVMSEIGMID
ncbi:MAG: glycosyltransferase, partial [Opitutales bacterium]